MSRFLSEKYKNLTPYTPGEQPSSMKYIKLNTNESPYPPSEKASAYAAEAAKKLELYPDPECSELTESIAKLIGADKDEVLVTNGSDEILNFAFMAFCDEKHPAVFPNITYGFYKVFAELNNVKYTEKPLTDDFKINIDNYTDPGAAVFIANPNAPTGILLDICDIEKIVSADTDRIVVIDEAYIDFGGKSCIGLIHKYNNLIVTQTFSKSRSMAGARIGFGAACKELIEDMKMIKYSTNPYNINRMSMAAALGAVEDEGYTKANCKKIIEIREKTKTELKKLGFTFTDSEANFIFAKHKTISGKRIYGRLREGGILVRHFDSPEITDYNRITIGSEEQMSALIEKLKIVTEEEQS